MEAISKINIFQDRFTIPLNVGFAGGDLPARYFAAAAVVFLTVLSAPPLQFAYSTLKIFALLASMSGTILLMAGLVFSQRTHFAGVMLIPTSFMMMGLAGWELAWPAVLVGLLVLSWISHNIVTKRCGINKLLGVNSCSK